MTDAPPQEPASNVVPMDRGDPDILKELRRAVRAAQRGNITAYMLVYRDAEGAWDTSMAIDNDLEALGVIERLRDEVKQEESDGA